MKVKYKNDPREWRKTTLLTTLGLAILFSVLRWRGLVGLRAWEIDLAVLAGLSALATAWPRWFHSFYRCSTWAGFWSSQLVARALLALVFMTLIVPAAFILRRMGKDPLHLKRAVGATTYWTAAKQNGSLDRLF